MCDAKQENDSMLNSKSLSDRSNMSSLTQQIIELKSQLRCIQENMEQWNDDECLQGIKMIILKLKEGLREVVFEKIYNHLSSKFDKSQKMLKDYQSFANGILMSTILMN